MKNKIEYYLWLFIRVGYLRVVVGVCLFWKGGNVLKIGLNRIRFVVVGVLGLVSVRSDVFLFRFLFILNLINLVRKGVSVVDIRIRIIYLIWLCSV